MLDGAVAVWPQCRDCANQFSRLRSCAREQLVIRNQGPWIRDNGSHRRRVVRASRAAARVFEIARSCFGKSDQWKNAVVLIHTTGLSGQEDALGAK